MQRGRLRRQAVLASISIGLLGAAWLAGDPRGGPDRVSIVSAWLCLAWLCAALSLGPLQALRTGRPVLNHLARRDLGICAALVGFVHFACGMALSMNNAYVAEFVVADGLSLTEAIRYRLFTWGNIAGFTVGVLFLLLLLLSNNRSLSLLGPRWWKRLQRASYFALAATVLHGLSFQLLESRATWLIAALATAGALVLVLQLQGRKAVR